MIRLHNLSSSLERPDVSLPKTIATLPSYSLISLAAALGVDTGNEMWRLLAVVAKTKDAPSRASAKFSLRTARFKISSAPEAKATASCEGKFFGLTKYKFPKPMVFIARAADPIFSGRLVETNTTLTLSVFFIFHFLKLISVTI